MKRLPNDAVGYLLSIGRHMGRERHQNGWVEPVGKRVRKWRGHFYVYERQQDGSEKRRHRIVDLGPREQLRKWEAEERLRAIIARETGRAPAADARMTLRAFYEQRFRPLKRWKASSAPKTERFIERYLLDPLGGRPMEEIDRFTLQAHLVSLAERYSQSVVQKARVYLNAIFEEAVEQEILPKNPARRLETPAAARRPSGRALTPDEVAALLAELSGRDQLIVRMLIVLGLRPGELFALRRDDVLPGRLRIDETVSDELRGPQRFVAPKTEASASYVWMPRAIEQQLRFWLETMPDQRPEALLFPATNGGPMRMGNYLRRVLRPAAERARERARAAGRDVPAGFLSEVTHQIFRRTCATQMQQTGTVRDIQAHLRHTSPHVTLERYMREIPESVRCAVERLDEQIMRRARNPH